MPIDLSFSANSDVGDTASMEPSLQNAKALAIAEICNLREDFSDPPFHHARMARTKDDREENHLRAWREFRNLTQEQLGEAAGTTGSVISLLEAGDRKLSLKWLRKLAPALNTSVGHLAEHDPRSLPTDILDIWASVPDDEKPRALDVLRAFRRSGTTGQPLQISKLLTGSTPADASG